MNNGRITHYLLNPFLLSCTWNWVFFFNVLKNLHVRLADDVLSLGLHLLSCCCSRYVVPPWSCLPRKTLTSSLSALLSYYYCPLFWHDNEHTHTHTHTLWTLWVPMCSPVLCESFKKFQWWCFFVIIVIVHHPQTSKGADFNEFRTRVLHCFVVHERVKTIATVCQTWGLFLCFSFEVKFEQNPFDCCKSFALPYGFY